MDPITAMMCGVIPPPMNRGPGGNQFNNPQPSFMDIFNRPAPELQRVDWTPMPSSGMAPSVPKAVDQGLGMQQMNYGNPMGGMNNLHSNFTAPRPMPAPAPATPAPMMPMKGMFGV